ncbi:NADP-dependent isocitrate dehydrogenase [Roseicyclus mahoneyensis]|uniref:isocitrate dehydrogenase (NADP(+)) n=1 Tax=Roseicyclus mahoneyensis TaxID=164332 RepID=A0A316GEC2_9RHOB|nr:NADP-dependent isocitrate dehydrogenase [Roseicyclus mahoneyensis]PWK59294.1 isocitrate dehydrogenase [Roseicyclus mahoneyensis]
MTDQTTPDIIYTKVDEAPELASASLLPIIRSFAAAADVSIGTRDISLAGRVLAAFPDHLTEAQRVTDDLAILGELVKTAGANVIKLPNISASEPQLVATIKELQGQGYAIPDYPENPASEAEKAARAKYDAIKGSAVNPVLREGNSDRRAAKAVKAYAQANPHRMGDWSKDSKTRVASMPGGDFRANETSSRLPAAAKAKIVLTTADGVEHVLKDGVSYPAGTVVDATYLSAKTLQAFLAEEIDRTKSEGVLFSLHLKATMMKVSDPIIFGHAVRAYLAPVFDAFGERMAALGVNPNSGLGDLMERVKGEADIMAAIDACMADRPPLYMVDSDRGLTNLHVPSDVIVDASMPALIRAGGKGWGPDNKEHDAVCVIPDNSYAAVYDETIKFFKEHGKMNPATAGTVQNLGLMAQKAEEYGSHPTTFEMPADGVVRMVLEDGSVLHEHKVQKGDIWRSASTRQAPIEDWVTLAIERQALTGYRSIFWLDATRAHDAQLIAMVKPILEAKGVADKFEIMAPREATRASFETITKGENCIAVTGNVLRDYLTDLFPILELATSAKMLSIVKLMQGGGMFETGAGGSAPKHVQQLQAENHLRWDSLGEFCALGESFKFLGQTKGNTKAIVLGDAVDTATQGVLDHDRGPGRKPGDPDNRDSHYWFARYWAEALAAQTEDAELAAHFAPIAAELAGKEAVILAELQAGRGKAVDQGGYYHTDPVKTAAIMRPSATLNAIIG